MIPLVVTEMHIKDFTFFQLIILTACAATDFLNKQDRIEKKCMWLYSLHSLTFPALNLQFPWCHHEASAAG